MNARTNRRFSVRLGLIAALGLAGIANAAVSSDFNRSGSVGLDDLQAFLAAYHGGDKSADANGDGRLTYSDVFTFVGQWTPAYIKAPKQRATSKPSQIGSPAEPDSPR